MGKVKTLILHPDMTFEEKTKKTESTNLDMDEDYKPSFGLGRSVFSEIGISRLKFWKKPRNLVILLYGAMKCFELHDSQTEEIEPNYWTMKEKKKFVKKIVMKSKAEQKPITMTQFIILALLLISILIMQFIVLRGIRIV